MYIPKAFEETDIPTMQHQIYQTRLAVLITNGEQGLQASHLPLLLRRGPDACGTLYGHLARANPQWRDLAAHADPAFSSSFWRRVTGGHADHQDESPT